MTSAERRVRERYAEGSPECERTVAAFVLGDGFRVYVWSGGERWIVGRGSTREDAWEDASAGHSTPPPEMMEDQ